MREMSVKEVKLAIGGALVHPPQAGLNSSDSARAAVTIARGVSTDTRQLVQGDLCIALTGPSFCGANFLDVAQ